MYAEGSLFALGDLQATLEARRKRACQVLLEWNLEQRPAIAETDVIDYLLAQHSFNCPVLHRDKTEQLPVPGEVSPLAGMFFSENYLVRKTKFVIAVPFDGEGEVFRLRATQSSPNLPSADVREGELRLSWTYHPQVSADATAIRQHFDTQLDKIEQHLSWSRADIDRHNANLRALATSTVARRPAKLLADHWLEADLGFPIRQRADAGHLAFPVTRRKIGTSRRPTASGPLQPEPFLHETQYEQALATLINARNSLERSPSMTAHLDEEKIRDLLLFFLNGQFEGTAAGEVFNAAGKTDILIRDGDRNVFIAECKIWKGPKTIRDALTQLLSYLTWRDTKAALLLFIRTGEPTTIITKSIAEIKGHANYKRTHGTAEDGERYDFILHANGDPNREIRLAFLPFALQDNPGQQ